MIDQLKTPDTQAHTHTYIHFTSEVNTLPALVFIVCIYFSLSLSHTHTTKIPANPLIQGELFRLQLGDSEAECDAYFYLVIHHPHPPLLP